MKQSPGPWEAKNMFDNWLIIDKDDIIVEIRGNKANAQLIAASPELLEYLEWAIRVMGDALDRRISLAYMDRDKYQFAWELVQRLKAEGSL